MTKGGKIKNYVQLLFLTKNYIWVKVNNKCCCHIQPLHPEFLVGEEKFFRKWPFSGEDDRGKTSPRALVFTRCDIQRL